tara:strand:- start:903 stop:1118 length:216 start_codon:yes stop_codon:yes gene_type:complete
MKHANRWRAGRKDTRKRKLESLSLIKKQFKNTKEYTKMNELIKLYMDSHDLVTTIGLEIAMLVDKEESKGC